MNQLFPQCAQTVAFPRARFAKQKQVFPTIQEGTVTQAFHLSGYLQRQPLPAEVAPRLGTGKLRVVHEASDPALPPGLTFQIGQVRQVGQVTFRLLFGLLRQVGEMLAEHRQPKISELLSQLSSHCLVFAELLRSVSGSGPR